MGALLEEVEAKPVQVLEGHPVAVRRAVTALFFVNGTLLATWVSRIPAIEALRGLNHTFGLALLVVATGAIISMPIAGALSARIGTVRICQFSALKQAERARVVVQKVARGQLGKRFDISEEQIHARRRPQNSHEA